MKIINGFKAIKETIIDSLDEFGQTADLDAEEYAKFYGCAYTNFLTYIKKQIFLQISEDDETEDISIEIPIASIKDKEIIFNASEFGAKEKFDMNILKNLLYRARINHEISEDKDKMILTLDNTERLSERIDNLLVNIYESKDEYIDKARDIASMGSQMAREKTKKLLKNLADYADKKL